MAITVKHNKVSTIPDTTDTSLVRPSDWNADHTLTGLGTMAEQNANAVAITGGTINGTTIGATTPATGKFSTLEATGNTDLGTGSANYIDVSGGATTVAPVISSQGSDTNINLVLQPKGTGALQAQATDSAVAGGNARGSYAVDWQLNRGSAAQVASSFGAAIGGGRSNTSSGNDSYVGGGNGNVSSGVRTSVLGGESNTASNLVATVAGGRANTAAGYLNFIGGGQSNSGTSATAVTTQATTSLTSGSTAVTLSGSNANIKVGQFISGTGITNYTYVAAISGTSLTLSQNATATGTPTLSFFTPHGVVVGGGNNQASGSYSFIGGGGDGGTAANRNTASGDWSVVCGGAKNLASGAGSFIGGGGFYSSGVQGNTASGAGSGVVSGFSNQATSEGSFVGSGDGNLANGLTSAILGGRQGTTRSIVSNQVFPACYNPVASGVGLSQSALLILGRQTTDATATALTSNTNAASNINQVILPNNSAYFFTGEIISGVTGGGNAKGFTIEGVIKRGANAAATTLVGSTVVSTFGDAGAATWTIALTADTTNGGLRVTFTGQAATTIRTVCQIRTTEMTF